MINVDTENQIKEEYQNALIGQSFPEMKKVAQKLMNYTCIESISEVFVTYTKYIKFRDSEYEINVEQDVDKRWHWWVMDEDDEFVCDGRTRAESYDDVFNEVISNFSSII